jgi:hypothetical protein
MLEGPQPEDRRAASRALRAFLEWHDLWNRHRQAVNPLAFSRTTCRMAWSRAVLF